MQLELPALQAWQQDIFDAPQRFKVVCVGRQAGKTTLASVIAFTKAYNGGNVFWVAPIYEQGGPGWSSIRYFAETANEFHIKHGMEPICNITPHIKLIEFTNGGRLQVKTGEDVDRLRGATLDYIVIEEAAFHKEQIWNTVLPSLQKNNGGALFISTPLGKNWFYQLFLRGQDESETEWNSWQLPSTVAPWFTQADLDKAKHDPLLNYKQELLAEFVSGGFNIFNNVDSCATAVPETEPEPGAEYVIGVDWGKVYDFTVVAVLKISTPIPELVFLDRFKGEDWKWQRFKIKQTADKFRPLKIIAEKNSIGDVNIEELRREIKTPVEAFDTTYQSKRRIIESLAVAFASNQISIIPEPALIHELEMFQAITNSHNNLIYSAPSKFHDDTVMALAFAFSATQESAQVMHVLNRQSVIGF